MDDDLDEINLKPDKRTDGKYAKQVRRGFSRFSLMNHSKPRWKRQLIAFRSLQRRKANSG